MHQTIAEVRSHDALSCTQLNSDLVKSSVCGEPKERVPSIPITLTSCNDSYSECSNISFYENKSDGVNLKADTL